MITQDSIKTATVEELKEYTQQTFNLVMDGNLSSADYCSIKEAIEERAVELNIAENLKPVFEFQEKSMQETAAEDKAHKLPPYFYTSEDGKKVLVSTPTLAEYIRRKEHYIFVDNAGKRITNRFWYKDGVYRAVSDSYIKGIIKGYIEKPYRPALKMKDVDEVFKNITTDLYFKDEEQINSNENIINFQNGILHLDTMTMTKHSPEVLSTIQIPCNWTGKDIQTPIFDKYMNDLTEGNENIKRFLMQFIGVCISNVKGFRMKKALFLQGKGDSGKSQLKSLVERLVGENNCTSIELAQLEERFGSSSLYGKRIAGSSDMKYVSVKELNIFKQVTGGDTIRAEFKCKDDFPFKYNGVMWFCMNELPKFGGDRGDWVYERIVVVRCNNSIPPEKQDKKICDKMYDEREGIIFKAVQALKEVIKNNYNYDIPEECEMAKEQYKKNNSPVMRFFDECCIRYTDKTRTDIYKAKYTYEIFHNWCVVNNSNFTPNLDEFKKDLAKRLSVDIGNVQFRNKHGTYYIFTLNAEAIELYST